MKPSHISIAILFVSAVVVCEATAQAPAAESQSVASNAGDIAQSAGAMAEVPRLIKFSGTLLDAHEQPVAGPIGVTFALYARQTGGAALWLETQNVKPDANANYTVLLGAASANGVPAELFTSAEARWLGIQVGQEPEQPRILLVSVPYALKAKDAETLGGLPASAFVTTEALSSGNLAGAVVPAATSGAPTTSASTAQPGTLTQTPALESAAVVQPVTACTAITSDGAAPVSSLAKFTTACKIEGSAVSESGGQVGIGGAPTSIAKLLLNQSLTNFGTKWLQRNLLNTTVTTSGTTNLALGLDVNVTNTSISAGVTDNGYRLGVRGQSQANTTSFAGALAAQYGVVGYAGISQGTSGAKVTNAFGGQFNILNQVPGTSITNAFGVYISNSETGGTITNRYDLFASSPNANNFFAGKVGIGTETPTASLEVNGASKFDGLITGTNISASLLQANNVLANSALEAGSLAVSNGSVLGSPVGIGTSSPQAELNLNFAGIANSDTLLVGNNSTKGLQLRDTGGAVDLESIGVPLFVNFVTGQPTFLFNSVGIGTSAPQAELNLNSGGTANADSLLLGNNTSRGLQLRDNGSGMDIESFGVPLNVNFLTQQQILLSGGQGQVRIPGTFNGSSYAMTVGAIFNPPQTLNSAAFSNDVFIGGTLEVASGTKNFRIDHPLDPLNKYLRHASIESSEVLNQYSGNVVLDEKGEARVQFPDWFAAINEDFRYQLTAIGAPGPNLYVAEEIKDNSFTIAGGKPGMKVSWQVTARRNDLYMRAHPFVVEKEKSEQERGRYTDPELYGAPAEQGIFPAHQFATKPKQ